MLTFIMLVAAFVVAQILTAVIAFAVMRNKSFMKWFYKWMYDYRGCRGDWGSVMSLFSFREKNTSLYERNS